MPISKWTLVNTHHQYAVHITDHYNIRVCLCGVLFQLGKTMCWWNARLLVNINALVKLKVAGFLIYCLIKLEVHLQLSVLKIMQKRPICIAFDLFIYLYLLYICIIFKYLILIHIYFYYVILF